MDKESQLHRIQGVSDKANDATVLPYWRDTLKAFNVDRVPAPPTNVSSSPNKCML